MRWQGSWLLFASTKGEQTLWWALWGGLLALTVVLILLMRTRWGQSQPLRKCVMLSILAHLLMAGYATTVQIVESAMSPADEPQIRITMIDGLEEVEQAKPSHTRASKPWEIPPQKAAEIVSTDDLERPVTDPSELSKRPLTNDEWKLDENSATIERPLAQPVFSLPGAPEPEKHTTQRSPLESPMPGEPALAKRQPSTPAFVPQSQEPTRNRQQAVSEPERNSGETPELEAEPTGQSPILPTLTNVLQTPRPASSLAGLVDTASRPDKHPAAKRAALDAAKLDESDPTVSVESHPSATEPPSIKPFEPAEIGPIVGRDASDTAPDASLRPLVPLTGQLLHDNRELKLLRAAPEPYQNRLAPDRLQIAKQYGGSAKTEAAVNSALAWLAANQSDDGRWDADRLGAGRDRNGDRQDRRRAGAQADTGLTGLALLAFLGAGHTHTTGDHQRSVEAGIAYLLSEQARDGNLGGSALGYAFMYCHGMATLALGEALAMTSDERIAEPLERAVRYTLRAQHPRTGGWRYHPGDLGDTSQLGWQLMALKSGEHSGIKIPERCRAGVIRFLTSVSSGRDGGRASYRPGERASRTMTAEALACRQLLRLAPDMRAQSEASSYLIEELPGDGERNFYYWYYATMALYQTPGDNWQRWNAALKETLVSSQRNTGPLSGSWDASTRWGGYGGRVYTTAMGALCLEVYYRFLPLYKQTEEIARHRSGNQPSQSPR